MPTVGGTPLEVVEDAALADLELARRGGGEARRRAGRRARFESRHEAVAAAQCDLVLAVRPSQLGEEALECGPGPGGSAEVDAHAPQLRMLERHDAAQAPERGLRQPGQGVLGTRGLRGCRHHPEPGRPPARSRGERLDQPEQSLAPGPGLVHQASGRRGHLTVEPPEIDDIPPPVVGQPAEEAERVEGLVGADHGRGVTGRLETRGEGRAEASAIPQDQPAARHLGARGHAATGLRPPADLEDRFARLRAHERSLDALESHALEVRHRLPGLVADPDVGHEHVARSGAKASLAQQRLGGNAMQDDAIHAERHVQP